MTKESKNKGWETRKVKYSSLYGQEEQAFKALLSNMNLQSGRVVGDLMGGYGEVSRQVLNYCSQRNIFARIILTDAYEAQLSRSYSFLTPFEQQGYFILRKKEDIRFSSIENMLDCAVIKLGLHELPFHEQPRALASAVNALKSKGSFYIWESAGQNSKIAEYFRRIVRKKDELAGYGSFVRDRYFPSYQELSSLIVQSGLTDTQEIYCDQFLYETQKMLDCDFSGDLTKLQEWNDFIRKEIPLEVQRKINMKDSGKSISMEFVKTIVKGTKP